MRRGKLDEIATIALRCVQSRELTQSHGKRRMRETVLTADDSREFYFAEGCHILELSNDRDDPSVSIARARVGAGTTTQWHYLVDTAERYVIQSGEGSVEIGELPPAEVSVGDVVRIPAGCPQRITSTSGDDLVFLAICTPRFRPENYRAGKPPTLG